MILVFQFFFPRAWQSKAETKAEIRGGGELASYRVVGRFERWLKKIWWRRREGETLQETDETNRERELKREMIITKKYIYIYIS